MSTPNHQSCQPNAPTSPQHSGWDGNVLTVPPPDLDALLRQVIDTQSELISLSQFDGVLIHVNAAYAAQFGERPGSMVGRSLYDFVAPDDRRMVRAHIAAVIARQSDGVDENLMLGAGGAMRLVEWTNSLLHDATGRPAHLLSVGRDKTDRRQAEDKLALQTELLELTLRSIGEAIIATDSHDLITFFNPVAERLTGWSADAAIGRPLHETFVTRAIARASIGAISGAAPPEHEPAVGDAPHAAGSKDLVLLSKTGAEFEIELSVSPIIDRAHQRRGSIFVVRDATERRRLLREAEHRAMHDPLTGLINRARFDAHLTLALQDARAGTQSALLAIDLDRFKIVNDQAGHMAGDALLRTVAQTIRDCVREHDDVARLGGDEFAVILRNCGLANAMAVADRICLHIRNLRVTHDRRTLQIGASIGLAAIDSGWTDTAALRRAADAACYVAKSAGRDRVYLHTDGDPELERQRSQSHWATLLLDAVGTDGFELHAQRIQPLTAGSARIHAEVLLRLRDRNGGLILPGAFMPAAERFQLAPQLDRWVVGHVLAWLQRRGAEADAIELLAVNLSGQSLSDPAFLHELEALLADAPIDASKICFEITETAAIADLRIAGRFLTVLRERGYRVALDDIGSGFTSPDYLRALPVDYLKIDGRIVSSMLADPVDRALLKCIQEIATLLGRQTIAEWVEQPEQLDMLRALGVDFAQGYLFHRPEPLDALLAC